VPSRLEELRAFSLARGLGEDAELYAADARHVRDRGTG
jgi:hypothetical protein